MLIKGGSSNATSKEGFDYKKLTSGITKGMDGVGYP
ncbi:hypothetical protein ACVW0P_002536 [Mucilaginibacter sp. UYNi724]